MTRSIFLLLAAALAAFPAIADDSAESLIHSDDLIATVESLAAGEMAGRLPGTEGYDRAADWCADRLRAAGLEPAGDDGYLQYLPMEVNEIDAASLALAGPDGTWRELELGAEFACRGFTGSGDVEAEIVFVGYGLSLPERGYDDYAGIDVTGKIVLAFKQAPAWRPKDGEGWAGTELPRPKAATARAHGAVGLLLVDKPDGAWKPAVIASVLHGDGEHVDNLPAVQVGAIFAADLVGGPEQLKALQVRIDEAEQPASKALDARARLKVQARYRQEAKTANVVGLLRGADPDLKDECLIIGAHLDHVGQQGDVVWPGANDNASGAAAVLHVAEAFAASGRKPARTVVFVLFAGEEQGLHGARFHAEHPVLPLEQATAMFNLDCVAHGDSISLGGGKSQPNLWEMARKLDRQNAGLVISRTWRGGGADAHPFWQQGVPTLYFATKNSYTHLHQTSDTLDTLNPELYTEVVRLTYRVARAVAMGQYEREPIREES